MTHKMTLEEDHKKVRVTWDDQAKAAYIRFVEGKVSKTKEVAPGLIADISSNGRLIGLEILDPENIKPETLHAIIKRFKATALSFNPTAIPDFFVKA